MDINQANVTNKLKGLPTDEELKALYIRFNFDRKALAAHLGMTTQQLLTLKKQLLGNDTLPPSKSYVKHMYQHQWFTYWHAEWTHPPKSKQCVGNRND
jgi:hypothetical protein